MAAAEGGSTTGATIPTAGDPSVYGGGGVGGKFRKRSFRGRQTTPYDRPSTATRPNYISRNNSSWLTKLVVDPAAKLLSYGADRFLASIFKRKQLPPPPAEVKYDASDVVQGAASDNQHREQSTPIDQENLPINEPTSNAFSELEQLLKQKTFTWSEIIHLTKLLQSRVNELSRTGGDGKKEIAEMNPLLEEGIINGVRSSDMSTGIVNSMVLEDNIASPAELAKSYMGSRPLKVSHSWRTMHIQTGREDLGVLGNTPLASKSPCPPLTDKTFTGQGAPENCFTTPRSLGRSAIYNLARTPHSRVRATSYVTGSNTGNNVLAPALPSSSASFGEHDDKLKNPMSLKRRNTVLDDEVGLIGPLRSIRQKQNLLVPRTYYPSNGVVTSSDVKQKRQLIGDTRNDVSHAANKYEKGSTPSTSYSRISPKSSEVAGRIFQHLEKLSSNEKSSESKLVATRDKQHLELKPNMLSARALKSMEDIESSKFMLDFKAAQELPDKTNSAVHDTGGSNEKQSPCVKSITSDFTNDGNKFNNIPNSADVSLKTSEPGLNVDSVDVPPPLPTKRGFRMSVDEDSWDQDDDLSLNGLAPRPLSEEGLKKEPPSEGNHLHMEQIEVGKATNQSEVKPSSVSNSVQRREAPNGDGGTNVSQASEEGTGALNPSAVPPFSSAFGKTKEANNHPPLFSFSSTVSEKLSSFSPESNRPKEESRLENLNSILNASASTGSQPISSESDKVDRVNSFKEGPNGKSENTPVKSDEPLSPAPVFGTAAASTSAASSFPTGTTNAVSSGTDIFGNAAKPVFKLGVPVDQSLAAVSTSLTADISEDSKRNVNGMSNSVSPFTFFASAGKSSGSSTFGPLSTNSTATTIQSTTPVSTATESPALGFGTTTGISSQSVTFASFGMNSSTSSVASLDSKPPNSIKTFGSTTTNTVTSADTSKPVPENGPTSSVLKFGVSSSAASDAVAVTSSGSSASASFSFGLNSTSTNPIGTSNGASPFAFGFGSNSSASSLTTNTASSFASGSYGSMFSLAASSSASSASATKSEVLPSWQSSKPISFGSSPSPSSSSSQPTGFSFGASSSPSLTTTFASSPSTGLSFGASSTPSPATSFAASPSTGFSFNAPSVPSTNTFAAPSVPSTNTFAAPSLPSTNTFASSPSTGFAFSASTTASASTNAAPAAFNPSAVAFPFTQPATFGGTSVPAFGASSPSQMNAEDSMVEDPTQSATPPVPVFGQPSAAPVGFPFGSTGQQPQAGNPFVFGGAQQNNQVASPNPFQASGSLEFNAGGSFSLGSGDKSTRKIVKINRNRNRRK